MSINGFIINNKIEKYEFTTLENIPTLNGVEISGDKTSEDYGINSGGGGGGSGGQPIPITLANEMTNTDALYLYLGGETGYDYGYIYAYLNDAWTKTELYGQGEPGNSGVYYGVGPPPDWATVWIDPSGGEGAIPLPSSASEGQFLQWNGTSWVAADLPLYDGGFT